jgi:hypothetical protein
MGVPTSEVGYTSATTGRGDHEVHKGHVVALEKTNWGSVVKQPSCYYEKYDQQERTQICKFIVL